ncbi:hypothetical protein [Streptomyces sp. TLI_146]|uniref:hypothetical protein n=1 Tax=Streptomyces sp. TLI_146 TaxID=1938858 RepID=UPI000CC1180B|nr:hypothetical protein [Streptomyces sp. TLI_146]PKV76963.1 hypothetical protein BX283_7887 [Streptomyces sp. TLI_146]
MKRLRMAGTVSTALAVAAGAMLLAAPSASASSSCHAYNRNDGAGVGWCDSGNGRWRVHGYCANVGGVRGPYTGSEGGRSMGKEWASILECGMGGGAVNMWVETYG